MEYWKSRRKTRRGGGNIMHKALPFLVIFLNFCPCEGQPFLNSLAVLFRARPPWPTTFPSSKFTPIPAPLITPSAQQGSSQGILVAHPIKSSSSPLDADGLAKSKKPDNMESVGPPLPSPQGSPFVPMASLPTLSPLIPIYPPPIPLFQNGHVLGLAGSSDSNHNGGSRNILKGSAGGIPPPPPLPNNQPPLLASPTSLQGNFADPPTTVPNPHYGVLLENSNFHKAQQNQQQTQQTSQHQQTSQQTHQEAHQHYHKKHKVRGGGGAWSVVVPSESQHSGHGTVGTNNNGGDEHIKVYKESSRKDKKIKDFRPSPQLNSFLETTVISDYGSHINANGGYNLYGNDKWNVEGKDPSSKDVGGDKTAHFHAEEGRTRPRFESGFRPISYDQYAANFGSTATKPYYTNSHQQYFNPWSIAFNPSNPQDNPNLSQSHHPNSNNNNQEQNEVHTATQLEESSNGSPRREKPFRQDRQIITGSVSQPQGNVGGAGQQDVSVEETSSSEEDIVYLGNRGKKISSREHQKEKTRHRFPSKGKKFHGISATISSTTASSELVEEWLPPGIRIEKKSDRKKYPIYNYKKAKPLPKPGPTPPKGLMKLPKKCEKFNRFGFCPVTKQYPLDAAEKIASRCTALMSHLIAPLPKMDVQYDTAGVGKNSSARRSPGWAWRSFQGKPVCDTDELTVLPGWARNENGDWMIILQTKIWQQKAHISLCSPSATTCQGLACLNGDKKSGETETRGKDDGRLESTLKYSKCVQRFTAQRLAVFDPEDPDRCPVVRSVFLPSACVCLTTTTTSTGRETSRSEERQHQQKKPSSPGHYSQFASRQPLFSSTEGESPMEDDVVNETYPEDSREGTDTIRVGHYNSHMKPHSPSTHQEEERSSKMNHASSPGGSSKVGETQGSHPRSSNFFESSPTSNATFMIITEKFTTNESSKETVDIPGQTQQAMSGNGTLYTVSSSSSSSS